MTGPRDHLAGDKTGGHAHRRTRIIAKLWLYSGSLLFVGLLVAIIFELSQLLVRLI